MNSSNDMGAGVPRNPYEVRRLLREQRPGTPGVLSRGARGALVGQLNRSIGSDAMRRLILGWLFGANPGDQLSSKDLTDEQWSALYHWVGPYKDENGEWVCAETFPAEMMGILETAVREYETGHAVDPYFDASPMLTAGLRLPGSKLVDIHAGPSPSQSDLDQIEIDW